MKPLQRMVKAIQEYEITGFKTTLNFCEFAIKHEAFTSGKFDTKFVEKYYKPEFLQDVNPDHHELALVLAALTVEQRSEHSLKVKQNPNSSNWKLRVRD